MQAILRELGHYEGEPDGYMGPLTGAAIGAFQASQGLPQTRAMSEDLVVRLYAVAGKGPVPAGHLYVRQDFKPVFDLPVVIADAQTPTGHPRVHRHRGRPREAIGALDRRGARTDVGTRAR